MKKKRVADIAVSILCIITVWGLMSLSTSIVEASVSEGDSWVPSGVSVSMGDSSVSSGDSSISSNLDVDVIETETCNEEGEDIMYLQVPPNIDFVIDPWNIQNKGGVYSEEYVIQNYGEQAAFVKLTNIYCKSTGDSNVCIKSNPQEVNTDNNKNIYIEMFFSDGEIVVLSQDGGNHSFYLPSNSEITFSISGKVNANSTEQWMDGDIKIGMTYYFEKSGEK